MSISNLQISKDTYTDVKCQSLETNSLTLTSLSLNQEVEINPSGSGPVTFIDETTCYRAIWNSAGPVATQDTFNLIVNLPSDPSNKNIQYSYRCANTQEKLVLLGVAPNVLQFGVYNCSTSDVGNDTQRIIDITLF
jgi:hypothetical protein